VSHEKPFGKGMVSCFYNINVTNGMNTSRHTLTKTREVDSFLNLEIELIRART